MFFEIEGAITGVDLRDFSNSTITISNVKAGLAVQKLTLEIANKDIAKAIAQTHGIDKPFRIQIGGEQ